MYLHSHFLRFLILFHRGKIFVFPQYGDSYQPLKKWLIHTSSSCRSGSNVKNHTAVLTCLHDQNKSGFFGGPPFLSSQSEQLKKVFNKL